ncbi:hypothetical protein [Desulfocicer niacini]
MQVENKKTVTTDELNSSSDPLQFACHALGKLEFLAETINSLCDYGEDDVFRGFDSFAIISMGEIIADATQELWAITNAAITRIDTLEAQLRVCRAVASTSQVNGDQVANHAE